MIFKIRMVNLLINISWRMQNHFSFNRLHLSSSSLWIYKNNSLLWCSALEDCQRHDLTLVWCVRVAVVSLSCNLCPSSYKLWKLGAVVASQGKTKRNKVGCYSATERSTDRTFLSICFMSVYNVPFCLALCWGLISNTRTISPPFPHTHTDWIKHT